jgi:DNA-binding NarL/FixJ family response regulator
VDLFAHLLGCALERAVLRLRLHELSTELRHLTSSAHALMDEALEAPVTLPSDFGHGPIFTTAGEFGGLSGDLDALLSPRERDIAALMVGGRSNRQIGDELHLSPDTVKVHVARLVRKLGAANRVEAVARYVSMRHGS